MSRAVVANVCLGCWDRCVLLGLEAGEGVLLPSDHGAAVTLGALILLGGAQASGKSWEARSPLYEAPP